MENFKEVVTGASIVFLLVIYYPYFRDIFQRKTKPHIYTWLIWAITIGIATVGAWKGGAEQGVLPFAAGGILVTCVALLSLKYGTKNITKSDTIALIAAAGALLAWWQFQHLALAVLIATLIDTIGYYPTFRKSYIEPESETISFWLLSVFVGVLHALSLNEYNFLTLFYLATILTLNGSLALFLYIRRKQVAGQ